jgi:hypothetical protein
LSRSLYRHNPIEIDGGKLTDTQLIQKGRIDEKDHYFMTEMLIWLKIVMIFFTFSKPIPLSPRIYS